ncbi:Dos2-interacting transcription regulator of RNA-Pol-II-domain-containing protein [Chytriomyces cf. hyalinus JEL632]|nr:Dos2-interacting transcription regulator of RNA-Pol-II-domain-containing protein [Chytriomyces cf. hyalinus JEL632]
MDTDSAHDAAEQLRNGSVSVLSLLANAPMSEALASSDPFERARATAFLSSVLSDGDAAWLRSDKADKNTVSVLMDFYSSRLHDQTSVADLLHGILALLASPVVTRNSAISLARAMFSELNNQNFAQNVRFSVYSVLNLLLKFHLEAMKYLGDNFIAGFLVAMDGEKDPRNILISFGIIHTIIQNFNIDEKFEDIFESIYCYFPITFRPPPNDPYGITSADLKVQLRRCFAASPLFGPLAWPILLEKLTSTSDNAKLDAMETISACAAVYGGDSIGRHVEQLWELLHEESLDSKTATQRDAALKAMRCIVYALSTSAATASTSSRDPLTQFLTFVTKHAQTDLVDATLPQEAVRRIVNAAAKATEPSFYYLATHLVKSLLDVAKRSSAVSVENQCEVLGCLTDFVATSKSFYGSSVDMDIDSLPQNPLTAFKEDLFQIFQTSLSSKSERIAIASLNGLFELAHAKEFLSTLELKWYFETLLGMSINENAAVRGVVVSLLVKEVSSEAADSNHVQIVISTIIPQLLDACALKGGAEDVILNAFEAVVELSADKKVFGTVVPALIKFLEESDDARLVRHSISALRIILTEQPDYIPEFSYYESLIVPVLRVLLTRSVAGSYICENGAYVESLGQVYAAIMRLLDSRSQEKVAHLVVNALYRGKWVDSRPMEPIAPVPIDARSNLRLLATVFSSVICNMKTDALLDVDPRALVNFLVQTLIDQSSASRVPDVYTNSLCQAVASILNKSDAKFVSAFTADHEYLFKLVESESASNSDTYRVAVIVLLWTTRATVMKSPTAPELQKVSRIVDLLRRQDSIVASKFYLLAADDPSFGKHVLTKTAFAKTGLLWKQKLFKHCLPVLVERFSGAHSSIRNNYLLALSHLMKYIAKSIILYEIQTLIPLLLAGLSSDNAELNLTILEITETLLKESPAALGAHLESFTTALLHLVGGIEAGASKSSVTSSGVKASASADVRVLSLKCLGIIPKTELPFNELYVLKPRVIRGLQVALDDEKKAVRKEAGNARAKWYLLLGKK